MKNKKRLIVIPALLGLIAGAGVIANNAMNSKTNSGIELNPNNDTVLRFSFTNGSSQDINWFEDHSKFEINAKVELEVQGATLDALSSTVFGIKEYSINFTGGDDTIAFDANDCNEDKTNKFTKCEVEYNLANIYGTSNSIVELVENAINANQATTNGILDFTINYAVEGIAVEDILGNKEVVDFTKDAQGNAIAAKSFDLNVAHTGLSLALA